MFARPSVQITTHEPAAPWVAIATDVKMAGPKAVGPVSSIWSSLALSASLVYPIGLVSRSADCALPLSLR